MKSAIARVAAGLRNVEYIVQSFLFECVHEVMILPVDHYHPNTNHADI